MAESPKTMTVQHVELARQIADVGKKLIDISMGLSRGVEVDIDYVKPVTTPTEPGLYRLSNNMVVELTKKHGWLSPNGQAGVDVHVRDSKSFVRLLPPKVANEEFAKSVAAYWENPWAGIGSSSAAEYGRALRQFANGARQIPGATSMVSETDHG